MKNWIRAYKKQHMIVITVLLLIGVVGTGAILGGCALKNSNKVVAAEEKRPKKQKDVSAEPAAISEADLKEEAEALKVGEAAEPEVVPTEINAVDEVPQPQEAVEDVTPTQETVNTNPAPTPVPESEPQEHVHNWVLSEAAWDEPVYAENRTICNSCNADITGNADHIFWCGIGSYRIDDIQIDTVHHPDVYTCSCGATK